MLKKYYCVKQHDMKDCAPACLASICKYAGFSISVSEVRELCGTDKGGTNLYGIVRAAEKLGFTAKAVKGTRESLFTGFPLPAIAHVVIDNKILHYVVIYKITKKRILIADPAYGIKKIPIEEFYNIWTGVLVLISPKEGFKKGHSSESVFSRFFPMIKANKILLIQIFLASILYTLIGMAGAFYFQYLIDNILRYNLVKTLHIFSLGIIILYIFKVFLDFFRRHLLVYLSQKLDINMILDYYDHLLKLPMSFFKTRKVGEILSRIVETSRVRDAISVATITIMIDSLMVIVGGIILYLQNKSLFLITVFLIPVYVLIIWGFHKQFNNLNEKQMEENSEFTSSVIESIEGIETIKAYTAYSDIKIHTEQKFIKFLKSNFQYNLIENIQTSIKNLTQLIGGALILWFGALEVTKGNLTVGQLIAYNALLAYFLDPLQNLINLQPTIQSAYVAANRLVEVLDLPEEEKEGLKKIVEPNLKGDIEIKNLDFRYGTRALTLENINLHITKGSKIGIVGESGSGKTSLIKLLLKFHPYENGDILINGMNIKDIENNGLRKKISYVSQETFFLYNTIYENLCLGLDRKPSLEEIIEVCKLTKAHEFINKLPLRYNTILEENASNLSGGQRQRLAIARALLKEPDILILDEATSNLDTITERAISTTLNHISKEITTIIIAHRLSTVKQCDKICVLEHGKIIEMGSHSDLMYLRGVYRNLWDNQFENNLEKNNFSQIDQSEYSSI